MRLEADFLQIIAALYSANTSCVCVNVKLSSWFEVNIGVRQCCVLSPTLFNIYVNDLVTALESAEVGVPILKNRVTCLLYADDVALVAEKEADLQVLLDMLQKWCVRWRMFVNVDKTVIMHFRPKRRQCTNVRFMYEGNAVKIVDKYKYLGIWFTEHVEWNRTDEAIAEAASKVVCTLISRVRTCGGLGFGTFSKLFDSWEYGVYTSASV